jgi:hypothetical protein
VLEQYHFIVAVFYKRVTIITKLHLELKSLKHFKTRTLIDNGYKSHLNERYVLWIFHYTRIKKVLLNLLISFCITSCAFVPITSEKQPYYQECNMLTKKLTLEPAQIGTLNNCKNNDLGECIPK